MPLPFQFSIITDPVRLSCHMRLRCHVRHQGSGRLRADLGAGGGQVGGHFPVPRPGTCPPPLTQGEQPSKNSGVHAAILAPGFVKLHESVGGYVHMTSSPICLMTPLTIGIPFCLQSGSLS